MSASSLARTLRGARRLSTAARLPLRPFEVERFDGWNSVITGAEGELSSLTSSEAEPLSLSGLLQMADDEGRRRWMDLSLGYPDQPGSSYLRDEIGKLYESAPTLNVCSPAEGIFLAMTALLEPGDHVVATSPCYQSLTEVARSVGAQITPWTPEGMEKPRFDPERLRELVEPGRTRLVVTNFPHNPTGALPSADEWDDVVAICDGAGAHLFHDEMYRGLEHGNAPSLLPACDLSKRGITLGGLSKTYGLPGLRIGWLASRDAALMARVTELKDYTSITPPAPSEALAFVALRAREKIIAAQRKRLAIGLEATKAFFDDPEVSRHLEWSEPSAGTFCLPRLKGGAKAADYCDALLKRTGLMLLPSTLFEGAGDDRVRLTYARDGQVEKLARWRADLVANGVS